MKKSKVSTFLPLIDYEPLLNCTDTGNAERLKKFYGDKLRYCYEIKQWIAWDGLRWQIGAQAQAEKYAKDVIQSLGAIASKIEDSEKRNKLLNWAITSEQARHRRAMLELARSEMPAHLDEFNQRAYFTNSETQEIDKIVYITKEGLELLI